MRGILTIARRELATALRRPRAYVMVGLFIAAFAGLTLFVDDLVRPETTDLRGPFVWMGACVTALGPALATGAFAAERRAGRWDLWCSLPVAPAQWVLGAWLAALVVIGAALVLTAPWPILIATFGTLDPGAVASGYAGVALLGAWVGAVGVAASAWSEGPSEAFVWAAGIVAVPWIAGWGQASLPQVLHPWAQVIAVPAHLDLMARGVLSVPIVVLFVSLTALFLRVATHALEQQRLA